MPFVHLPGYAEDLGLTSVQGALFVVALGSGGLIGRLFIGWFTETVGHLWALTVTLIVQVISYLAIIQGSEFEFLLLMTCLLGLGVGSTSVQFNAFVPDIFGRAYVGAISGFIFAIAGGAAAIGPYLAGFVRDVTGSFEGAFWFGAVVNAIGLCFVWFIRKPGRN